MSVLTLVRRGSCCARSSAAPGTDGLTDLTMTTEVAHDLAFGTCSGLSLIAAARALPRQPDSCCGCRWRYYCTRSFGGHDRCSRPPSSPSAPSSLGSVVDVRRDEHPNAARGPGLRRTFQPRRLVRHAGCTGSRSKPNHWAELGDSSRRRCSCVDALQQRRRGALWTLPAQPQGPW